MENNHGRVDKAAKNARPTLASLRNQTAKDSYEMMGTGDEGLPTSPTLGASSMFRTNSNRQTKPVGKPAAFATQHPAALWKPPPAITPMTQKGSMKPADKPAGESTDKPSPLPFKLTRPKVISEPTSTQSTGPTAAKRSLPPKPPTEPPSISTVTFGASDPPSDLDPDNTIIRYAAPNAYPPEQDEIVDYFPKTNRDESTSSPDMPRKLTPQPEIIPEVIITQHARPKQSILKAKSPIDSPEPVYSDVAEPIYSEVGAPSSARKAKFKDVDERSFSHEEDPERTKKINKRRATKFDLGNQTKQTPEIPRMMEVDDDQGSQNTPRFEDDAKPKSKMVSFQEAPTEEKEKAQILKARRATTHVRRVEEDGTENDSPHAPLLKTDQRKEASKEEEEEEEEDDDDDDNDDDDDDEENGNEKPKSLHQLDAPVPEKKYRWDMFRTEPVSDDNEGIELLYELMRKLFKIVTIMVCFLVVGGGAMIHKATLLFAAAQLTNDHNYTCIHYIPADGNISDYYHCVRNNDYASDVIGNPKCIDPVRDTDNTTWTSRNTFCVDIQVRWVWCLVLILATPEIFTFIRCLWNVSFKKRQNPSIDAFFVVALTETLSVLGMCCFVFSVLPALRSSIHGMALMLAIGVIPAVLNAMNRPDKETAKPLQIVMDVLMVIIQLSGLVLWPVLIGLKIMKGFDQNLTWSIPLSLFLMSFPWWLNFIDGSTCPRGWAVGLVNLKTRVQKERTKIYLIVSIWKMGVIILGMFLFSTLSLGINFNDLFSNNLHKDSSCSNQLTATDLPGQKTDFVFVWLINAGVAIASYMCARAATKVHVQFQAYAMPLVLVSPILSVLLMAGCHSVVHDNCALAHFIPSYLNFDCKPYGELLDMIKEDYIWVLYIWWLAQMWVTKHIWFPTNKKLAKTATLFFNPLYGGVAHEQWLLYNRYPKDINTARGHTVTSNEDMNERAAAGARSDATLEGGKMNTPVYDEAEKTKDSIPQIYICATMWHEAKEEMVYMLKSILKLDLDQCTRKQTQGFLNLPDADYFNFEAHIFFDDCMDRNPNKGYSMFDYAVNDFVRDLVAVVDTAASYIYNVNIMIPPPTKYPTPYGGRLVWVMPGDNRIICHLKDKEKIRVKKRWSQVMYMYYFLGFKLCTLESDLPLHRIQTRADNTFLLALDGDIDFEPGALRLLVDLMKKNIKVGAACGRIHPTGSGPMVWYQKFEYALGHWMQKATEHVLGCVLCSPGCFSLFRGSSLMDTNIMNRYTTTSEEARHLVQYDQGEDRWLCTLLLQRGYRVEYSAASDSFTAAPEEFNVFFNQRRRWTPSTMANVLDLLGSWRTTVKVNENLSILYMMYQGAIFGSSLLGTGTIFLMIVGALVVATDLTMFWSFLLNAVLVVGFLIVCLTTPSKVQLIVANVLTIVYGLIQVLVLIAIIIQMAGESLCAPTFVFFMYVAGTFILAALLHPQEFLCIIHGLLYFILIPSMYMLLMIYSLTNLNDVSWGTREVKQTRSQKEQELFEKEEVMRKEREKKAKESSTFHQMMTFIKSKSDNSKQNTDGWTMQLGNCCRFMCCPRPVEQDKLQLNMILEKITEQKELTKNHSEIIYKQNKMVKVVSKQVEQLAAHNSDLFETLAAVDDDDDDDFNPTGRRMSMSHRLSRKLSIMPKSILKAAVGIEDIEDTDYAEEMKRKEEKRQKKEEKAEKRKKKKEEAEVAENKLKELYEPKWIQDKGRLSTGPIKFIDKEEEEFFLELIKKYLPPLIKDSEKEEKVNQDLKDLKNKVSFGYILLNATFIVVISTLQNNREMLEIPWFCDDLKLEPIGLMFLIFFAFIMALQTYGMLHHRMGTFLHIVADTNLITSSTDIQLMVRNLIKGTKLVDDAEDSNEEVAPDYAYDGSEEVRKPHRKTTIYQLDQTYHKKEMKRRPTIALADKLEDKLRELADDLNDDSNTVESISQKYDKKRPSIFSRRKSLGVLHERRKTISRPEKLNNSRSIQNNLYESNEGYNRMRKNNKNLAMKVSDHFEMEDEPQAQMSAADETRQRTSRAIPIDKRKVSRFSQPVPDYESIIDIEGPISPRLKSTVSISPDYDDVDDNNGDNSDQTTPKEVVNEEQPLYLEMDTLERKASIRM